MKTSTKLVSVLTISLFVASVALAAAAAKKAAPQGPRPMVVAGSVAAADQTAKTLSVKDAKGKTVDLAWDDATKVTGGTIEVGQRVRVNYKSQDGKNMATAISIQKASAGKAPKTGAATTPGSTSGAPAEGSSAPKEPGK